MAKELLSARDFLRMLEKINLGPDTHCWEWEASNRGENREHGRFRVGPRPGKLVDPYTVMWELYNDASKPEDEYMLHSRECTGKGGCCNPTHLRTGSQQENMEDASVTGRISHGEDRWSAKLTEEDIREIRRRFDRGQRVVEISQHYPVSVEQIRLICLRRAWKHVTDES